MSFSTSNMGRPLRDPIGSILSTTPLDTKLQRHLRRVYTTLTVGVIVATLGALVDSYLGSLYLGITAGFVSLPVLLWFTFQPSGSKNRPYAFYLFAFLDGMAAGPLLQIATAAEARMLPLIAFAGALVVFVGFSLSALFAKRRSYLFLGSFLWTALMGMLFIQMINLFTSKFYGFSMMLYGGLFMMFGFVLYDTQMIVEKVDAGDTDYFKHAMELLIDFVIIFKRLLIILLKNDQERKREENRRKRN